MAPSPNEWSTAKHIEPVDERGQAAGAAGRLGDPPHRELGPWYCINNVVLSSSARDTVIVLPTVMNDAVMQDTVVRQILKSAVQFRFNEIYSMAF